MRRARSSARALSRRTRLAALCALACAGGGLALASGALASSPAQGNPQGIKLAERTATAFAHIPALTYSEQGFFQISTTGQSISYDYGYGGLQSGYSWASEHATVALSGGTVVWWRDDLTPVGGSAKPVELVATKQGVFSALGDGAHHSCFEQVSGSVPYSPGGSVYSIAGRYKNGASPLRSVYRWFNTNQLASETDNLAGNGLITSGRVSVAGGPSLQLQQLVPRRPGAGAQHSSLPLSSGGGAGALLARVDRYSSPSCSTAWRSCLSSSALLSMRSRANESISSPSTTSKDPPEQVQGNPEMSPSSTP